MITRLLSIFCLLVLFWCTQANIVFAQKNIPRLIQVQARLMDENAPVTTPQKIQIKIIDGGNATQHTSTGKVLYTESTTVTPDAMGYVTVVLGDEPGAGSKFNPEIFSSSAKMFVEFTRFENNKPKIILPRQQIVSVAYALQTLRAMTADNAAHATDADHADKADQAANALKAEKAINADKATVADRALIADKALLADKSTMAESAKRSESALTADKAKNADYAEKSELATKALNAEKADMAATALKADNATLAQKALKADEALKANVADKALLADRATVADRATKADEALKSQTAQQAVHAASADKAANADHALKADDAVKAETADHASNAKLAERATLAEHATKADEAANAATADRATKAITADKALQADNATTADNANSAAFADEAMKATLANQAKRANRADTAMNALRLGNIEAEEYLVRPLQKDDVGKAVITTENIEANSITTGLIRDGAITPVKIAKGSLTGDLFKEGSIPQSKLQPILSARKLKSAPPPIDSVDVTGNLSVSGNLFHRFGTLYTPLIRSDGYIFSRFMSADGILFALKGSVSGQQGTAVEGNVQSEIGSSFLASGFGDMFRGQKIPQFSGDPILYRITNRADVEVRNTANDLIYNFIADSSKPVLTLGGPTSMGSLILKSHLGEDAITMSGGDSTEAGQMNINGSIVVKGKELRVRDYAEVFELENKNDLQPGQLVVIDENEPGRLKLATKAYDKSVAGVISGGDASSPGVMLGTRSDGSVDKPVALAGRVYCYVDADIAEIKPGDLLTTSPTPGHAMRVTNFEEAQGAIIGKAMQGLKSGKGKILILVTLQ